MLQAARLSTATCPTAGRSSAAAPSQSEATAVQPQPDDLPFSSIRANERPSKYLRHQQRRGLTEMRGWA
jgi:hypothetical protein